MEEASRWASVPGRSFLFLLDLQLWIELFVLFNFVVLVLDIYLAHSENEFYWRAEYFPIYFSAASSILLPVGLITGQFWRREAVWRDLGYLVGWVSVATGLAGVIYHLDSQFFYEKTLRSLTYTAPFVAPLALAGVGLLLIVNRMVRADTREWAEWVLMLTLGGFFGNFVLSLADHAENGFFRPIEWLPVAGSAFAVSFLLVPFLMPVTRRYLGLCALVLLFQTLIGGLGFILHNLANLRGPSPRLFENLATGAPPLAPLLFANLSVLGWIGLWAMSRHVPKGRNAEAAFQIESSQVPG